MSVIPEAIQQLQDEVQKLIDKVEHLEALDTQGLAALEEENRVRSIAIEGLQENIRIRTYNDEVLRKRIEELEAGACRFNCRTNKEAAKIGHAADFSAAKTLYESTARENWCAGYRYRAACGRGLHFENEAEMCYEQWKRQQEASNKDD